MSWVRRLLLLAGLVFGSWLLGSIAAAAEANADISIGPIGIDVEIDLPIAEISVDLRASLDVPVTPPAESRPAPSQPRAEVPPPSDPVSVAAEPVRQPVTTLTPVHVEMPAPQPAPATVPEPAEPSQHVELPMPGTPPQSGAGQSSNHTQPVGALATASPGTSTHATLVRGTHQDVPLHVHVEDPSFSPD